MVIEDIKKELIQPEQKYNSDDFVKPVFDKDEQIEFIGWGKREEVK